MHYSSSGILTAPPSAPSTDTRRDGGSGRRSAEAPGEAHSGPCRHNDGGAGTGAHGTGNSLGDLSRHHSSRPRVRADRLVAPMADHSVVGSFMVTLPSM